MKINKQERFGLMNDEMKMLSMLRQRLVLMFSFMLNVSHSLGLSTECQYIDTKLIIPEIS